MALLEMLVTIVEKDWMREARKMRVRAEGDQNSSCLGRGGKYVCVWGWIWKGGKIDFYNSPIPDYKSPIDSNSPLQNALLPLLS